MPDTVLFPGTNLSLHIFEPRYREMVRDVTAGEGLIVVSLMTGNDFRNLGTLGMVRDLERLEDGRFNLRLEGLERVSIAEVPGDTTYRCVRIESRPERMGTSDAGVISEARLEMLASYGILRSMADRNEPFAMHPNVPFEVVVNTACANLPIDASLRQRLLKEDSLISRQRLGMEYFSSVVEAMSWLRATGERVSSLPN